MRRFVVCSGGGGGIMEAANRGARDAGGRTIGLNIGLPHEQRPEPVHHARARRSSSTTSSCASSGSRTSRARWSSSPGGFGTLDELFEILTLDADAQARARHPDRPLRLELLERRDSNFDALVRHGMIAREDLTLFSFADDPRAALALLQAKLPTHPERDHPPHSRSRARPPKLGGRRSRDHAREFIGAAQTVTGSKHLLRTSRATVLLDCGLFQGRRRESFEHNRNIPVDGRTLDAVVLSHAHIDHSGALPLLCKNGYRRAHLRDAGDARSLRRRCSRTRR